MKMFLCRIIAIIRVVIENVASHDGDNLIFKLKLYTQDCFDVSNMAAHYIGDDLTNI